MLRFVKTSGYLAAAAILVGACTSSPVDRFYGFNDTLTVDKTLLTCLKVYVEYEGTDEAKNIHDFLDCGFQTSEEREAGTGAADVDENDLPLRMFRAHAIVGALAVYGDYSMQVDVDANRENAAVLLSSIEEAESELWAAFKSASGTPTPGYVLQADVDFFDRIRLVYKVAEGAARPGVQRAKGFFKRIAVAIAGQNPLAVFTTIKDAREGIARALTARRYSVAYIRGIRNYIIEIKTRQTDQGVVTADDMRAVDTFYLDEACNGLAKTAGVKEHHCIPDRS